MANLVFNTSVSSTGGGGGDGVTNIGTSNGVTGGPITSTGVISLANIADGTLLANVSGSSSFPSSTSLSPLLDYVLGDAQGSLLYRNASEWTTLAAGTSGHFLQTSGPSGNPVWAAGSAGDNFPYVNTLFVAQSNGDDSNSGASINDPLLTVQAAVTLAANQNTVIYVIDAYLNEETISTLGTGQLLYIYAPATEFNQPLTFATPDKVQILAQSIGELDDFTSSIITCYEINQYYGNGAASSITAQQCDNISADGGALDITAQNIGVGSFSDSAVVNVSCLTHGMIHNDGTATLNGMLGSSFAFGFGGRTGIAGPLTIGTDINTAGLHYTLPDSDGDNLQVLTTDGGGHVSWLNAPGQTNFEYTNAIWVDPNGDDGNSGNSANEPLALIQTAINTAGTTPTVIYAINFNTNNETLATTGAGQVLNIIMPSVSLQGNFTLTATDQASITCEHLQHAVINGFYNIDCPLITNIAFGASSSGWIFSDQANTVSVTGGTANLSISQIGVLSLHTGATVLASVQRYTTCTNDGTATLNKIIGSNLPLGTSGPAAIHGPLTIGVDVTTPGDHYTLPAYDGAPQQVLTTNGAGLADWATSPGSVFTPFYTIYFAQGGNDGGLGTPDAPLATLGQAVANAQVLLTAGVPKVSIVGLGVGTDTSVGISITKSGIDIYAPGYALNPATGDALTVDTSGAGSASYINVVLAASTVASGANVLNLLGTTSGHGNVTRFTLVGATTGSVSLAVQAEYYTTIITGTLTAAQGSKVEVLYGIGSQTQQTRLNKRGLSFGADGAAFDGIVNCTNAWRYPMRRIVQLTGDITLDYSNSGFLFINSTTSTYTVTLPDATGQGTPAFVLGYESEFLNLSTGAINFEVEGSDVLVGPSSITEAGQRVQAVLPSVGIWTTSWQNSGGSPTNFDYENAVWVAQNGNDSNTGTSLNEPVLTVQKGIDNLPSGGSIYIPDNAIYSGSLSIPSGINITIVAPSAFLDFTNVDLAGGGSVFKVQAYSFGTNFNTVISSSSCIVYIQAEKVRGDFGDGTSNPSQMFIKAQEITGNYTTAMNATLEMSFDTLAGDIVDTSPSSSASPSITINGRSQTGDISSTNNKICGYLAYSSGTPSISGIKQGYFNGVYYGETYANDPINGQPYNIISWASPQSITLNSSNYQVYSNAMIYYTGSTGYGRFILTNDAAIPVGFKFKMFQGGTGNGNAAGVNTSTVNIIGKNSVPDVAYTANQGGWLECVKVIQDTTTTWSVFGDLQ